MKKDKLYTVSKYSADRINKEAKANLFAWGDYMNIVPKKYSYPFNPNYQELGDLSPYRDYANVNYNFPTTNTFAINSGISTNPYVGINGYLTSPQLGINAQSNVNNWTNQLPSGAPLNPTTDNGFKEDLSKWQQNNPMGGQQMPAGNGWMALAQAAPGMAMGVGAAFKKNPEYSADAAGNGFGIVDKFLARGNKSQIGMGGVNVGASLMNSGLKNGNAGLILAGGIAGTVGTAINAGWGINENEKNIKTLTENNARLQATGRQLASATTSDSFIQAAANMGNGTGFRGKDLVTGGYFAGGKAAREANKYLNAEKQALAYQGHAMAQGAQNVDKIQDDNVKANFAAGGGWLNYGDMGALEYGLALDAINARKRNAEIKDRIPNNPFGALASAPFNEYVDGGILFSDGGPLIKKENRGKFTAQAKAAGMGTQQFASHVLANKEDYSPTTVKRANFAHVFGGRNYNYGGPIFNNENLFDIGGVLQSHGSDWSNGSSHIDEGGTHEENPYQGVQVGVDSEGTPNLVEEGEIIYNDYVYSQRIELDDEAKEKFHFSKKRDITYADAAKKLEKEISERPNDPLSRAAFKSQMQDLAEEQERQKAEMQAEEAREQFESLSPEEQVAVMQNAEAQEQQAAEEEAMMQEQAAQEQAMQEQAAMQGQPTEEQMMQEQMMAQQQGMTPQQPMGLEAQMGGYAYGGLMGNQYGLERNLFLAGGDEDKPSVKRRLARGWGEALSWPFKLATMQETDEFTAEQFIDNNFPSIDKKAKRELVSLLKKAATNNGVKDSNGKISNYRWKQIFSKNIPSAPSSRPLHYLTGVGVEGRKKYFQELYNAGMSPDAAFEMAFPNNSYMLKSRREQANKIRENLRKELVTPEIINAATRRTVESNNALAKSIKKAAEEKAIQDDIKKFDVGEALLRAAEAEQSPKTSTISTDNKNNTLNTSNKRGWRSLLNTVNKIANTPIVSTAPEASGTLMLNPEDIQGTYMQGYPPAAGNTGNYGPTNYGTASGGYYQAPAAAQPAMPNMPPVYTDENGQRMVLTNQGMVPAETYMNYQQALQERATAATAAQPTEQVTVIAPYDENTIRNSIFNAVGSNTWSDFVDWAKKNNIADEDFLNTHTADTIDWEELINNENLRNALKEKNPYLADALSRGYDYGKLRPSLDDAVTFKTINRGNWKSQDYAGWNGSEDPAWLEAVERGLVKEGMNSKQIGEALKQTKAFQRGTQWLQSSEDNRLRYLRTLLNDEGTPEVAKRYARKFINENGWIEGANRDYASIFGSNGVGVRETNPGTYWHTPTEATADDKVLNLVRNNKGEWDEIIGDIPTDWKRKANYSWRTVGDKDSDAAYINNVVNYYETPEQIAAAAEQAKANAKTGDAAKEEEPARDVVPVTRSEWPRYAGLFGPAVGLGMMAAGIGKPNLKDYEAALEIANGGASLASYMPIGNYLKYQPMDIWAQQNRMDANSRATDRAILNNSSPVGTRNAGLLANSYNSQLGSGELYRNALQYNDQLMQGVGTFNRATDMFNAEAFNRASATNAEIRNRDRQLRAQIGLQTAAEKAAANAGWYNSLYGNVAGLFKGFSDLGRENAQRNMIAKLAASGAFGTLTPENAVGAGLVEWADEANKKKKKNWLSIFG